MSESHSETPLLEYPVWYPLFRRAKGLLKDTVCSQAGVGKTTFAKLLCRYLKACRILTRPV